MSAPARTSVRAAMNRNEPPREQLARHVRYVAADPVLADYHREREARLLELVARRLDGQELEEGAAIVRTLAHVHRNGGLTA